MSKIKVRMAEGGVAMGLVITVILAIAWRYGLEYLVIFEVHAVLLIHLFFLISSSSDPIMYILQCSSVLYTTFLNQKIVPPPPLTVSLE